MSKELNIREVMANIKEGQEYKCEDFIIKCLDNGTIEIGTSESGKTFGFFKEDKFTKIQKPVSFTEAFIAYEEGKTIESLVNKDVVMSKKQDMDMVCAEEISGEWYILEDEKEIEQYSFQLCTDKWITKDGVYLEIKNMSRKHIHNSMKMIERICKEEKWKPQDYNIYNLLNNEFHSEDRFND